MSNLTGRLGPNIREFNGGKSGAVPRARNFYELFLGAAFRAMIKIIFNSSVSAFCLKFFLLEMPGFF